MNQLFLSDEYIKDDLFPFGLVSPVSSIRTGILTIREKWQYLLGNEFDIIGSHYPGTESSVNRIYSSSIIPDQYFIDRFVKQGKIPGNTDTGVKKLQYPWQIMQWNDEEIRNDYSLITKGRRSAPVPDGIQTIAPENIFIEPGARLSFCTINASTGPVYIGPETEIMEGAMIRGPFALCTGSTVKMGAKIYGATTIGPYSVAGGEIKNSVIQGYSNKAHDGYLGDSVIGNWCNLGAGTSGSNVKNTAGQVKVWFNKKNDFIYAGLKCGLMMGDYSVAAINTSFNTGTVAGICSNIFGPGLMPKFIPSFSWGSSPPAKYEFEKALIHISNWKKLKNKELTSEEIQKLRLIFENLK